MNKKNPFIFYEDETIKLFCGSNLDILPTLPDNSVDSIVTDPPYELGFMGKKWDSTGIAYNKNLWSECLRVLKPGGFLLAFSGTRTYHRMAVAIEDSGFIIKDQIGWLYGSGFPKALDIAKTIDKRNDFQGKEIGKSRGGSVKKYKNSKNIININNSMQENENGYYPIFELSDEAKKWEGWKTSLKPAWEPIVLAQKPISEKTYAENVLKWRVGALNIDECRISYPAGETNPAENPNYKHPRQKKLGVTNFWNSANPPNKNGRYPANIIHDDSQEVINAFPNTKKGGSIRKDYQINNNIYGDMSMMISNHFEGYGDSGSAARFFYGAKASVEDREEGLDGHELKLVAFSEGARANLDEGYEKSQEIGINQVKERKNFHPTIKPTDLMQYLIRLVTPTGGVVLDPFMGSGSTGKGAIVENIVNNKNYRFLGIDMTKDYLPIARDRILKGSKEFVNKLLNPKLKTIKKDENQLTLFEI